MFAEGVPVKSPDICTWLILQIDFLRVASLKLGRTEETAVWDGKAAEMLATMLEILVENDRFIAKKIPVDHNVGETSLLLYVPLLLGKRLPEDLRQNMLESLLEKGRFKTDYGYASEALNSWYFEEDGYWRGAVWPPLSYIVSEILRINGYEQKAMENARSYCDICLQSGFAENYSALDGRALRDSGYTWTTSVFLVFLRDYLTGER